jgi:nucleotide-binding universal stress UspA family protein
MTSYSTIVVGTDGSQTSLRAVDRAATVAGDAQATLVLVSAYHPARKHDVAVASDALRDDAYLVVGSSPAERNLREAAERAKRHGAGNVKMLAVEGDPGDVLVKTVADHHADLLVVGNRGLNTLAGRLLGSVPSAVAHHASCDVMIVRTTN